MRGKITKIHDAKVGLDGVYYRIEFVMEDGSWAKTDIVPHYRNFKNWKLYIERRMCVYVEGLNFRRAAEIDGDSIPLVCDPFKIIKDGIDVTQFKLF